MIAADDTCINCPNCGGQMVWDGEVYICTECGLEIDKKW